MPWILKELQKDIHTQYRCFAIFKKHLPYLMEAQFLNPCHLCHLEENEV